jgi:murein DD-endopeptidase MepM/ murein hydrolase activator NlpD
MGRVISIVAGAVVAGALLTASAASEGGPTPTAAVEQSAQQWRARDRPVSVRGPVSAAQDASATVSPAQAASATVSPAQGRSATDLAPPDSPVRYEAPVTPVRVERRFDPPQRRFGPGHLGVDLETSPGAAVRAAADGVVTFAGPVAGRGVVVVRHADGVSTEYEPLRPAVAREAVVVRGQVLGRVAGAHGTCAPGRCLHWGARRGDEYIDPLLLLVPLGPVRLLPWSERPDDAARADFPEIGARPLAATETTAGRRGSPSRP